ncbi:hypothetical protein STSP_23490 [Streptomyces jeddahensis]|uniref:PAS domain-containing protein n=1 Tax=Streptomyces jeddahensis TaxID=1716141 RepID=A0A177HVY7_9ACTN|nr:hypothetical protein STSP_23490 [Streptomyces jeddahensis]
MGVVWDTHEARSVQDALSRALRHIRDGFVLVDDDWRITFANLEAERTRGSADEALSGRVLWTTMRYVGAAQRFRKTDLDRAISHALAPWRKPRAVHGPGKALLDVALAVALGGGLPRGRRSNPAGGTTLYRPDLGFLPSGALFGLGLLVRGRFGEQTSHAAGRAGYRNPTRQGSLPTSAGL